MNTQQEYEKLKQEGISKILEDANGSWYDLVNDGFDLAKKLRQSTHPIAADAEILVPVPGQEDGNFRDGKEIKTWMDAWLIGYKTAMKEYASQPKGAGVPPDFLEYVSDSRDEFIIFINSLPWDTELRTACESLIICFDQMKDRLSSLPSQEGQK